MAKPQMVSTRTFKSTTELEAASSSDAMMKPKLVGSPRLNRRTMPWVIIAILVIASMFLFLQYESAKSNLTTNNASVSGITGVNKTIEAVSKLVVVPTGQTPTVATVQEAQKLRSQTFFAHADDGDEVVIYAKADEAILYRPSTNQIVNISAISINTKG